jgi:uncharacterized protein GlcG (DUF336 family)
MKTKITLLKSVALGLLFMQGAISTATTIPVTNSALYAMPNFAPAATIITSQPQSVNSCEGETVQFTVSVASDSAQPTYIWRKNGAAMFDTATVSGTATATLTITNVSERDAAAYTCFIFDGSGSVVTQPAYLNAAITSENGSTTCAEAPTVISVEAIGNNVKYQWYASATESNVGGTLLAGQTSNVYYPQLTQEGTYYYYAVVYPDGFEDCAAITSNPIVVNIGNTNPGVASQNQIVCPNSPAALSISNSFGAIQWQQSLDGINNWTNVTGGIGENTANYITENINASMFYRAEVGNVTCGIEYSDVIAVTVTQTYTWTGASGSDWNNTANWACSKIPTLNENVLIPAGPGNQPVVSTGTAYAKTLTVENGAAVTVETGKTLHVQGSITVANAATVTVEHNAALIQDNDVANSGKIKVMKNSNPLYRLDYTMWSSPVSGQQLQAFSSNTLPGRFYEYRYDFNPATGTSSEEYFPVDATTNFETGKAYLIRMPNGDNMPQSYADGTTTAIYNGVFTGIPNNGTVSREASTGSDRYTAVGNPYPSPINVVAFFNQNESVLEEDSAIYLWRKRNDATATSYATLTKAGFVANDAVGGGDEQADFYTGANNDWILSHGQGFVVKAAANPGTPNIVFSNSMRRPAAEAQGFFRTGQSPVSRLWLNLRGNNAFSQAAVAYMDGATTGIDRGYDGLRINEGVTMSLYTVSQNRNLAIQARPTFNAEDAVPVGFVATAAGEYTIAVDHTEGVFNNGQAIFIKDNLLNTTTALTEAYTFTSEAGTFNSRFEIVYAERDALNTKPVLNANNVIVFKDASGININSGVATMTNVTIYDMGGRTIYTKNDVNSSQITVPGLQAQQQVLIVEINTELGKTSKKVVY